MSYCSFIFSCQLCNDLKGFQCFLFAETVPIGYSPSRYLVSPTGTTETLCSTGAYAASLDKLSFQFCTVIQAFAKYNLAVHGDPCLIQPLLTFFSASPAKRLWSILQRSSGFMVWMEILMGSRWYRMIRSIS